MTSQEAADFIRPAVEGGLLRWADLGAGRGTFTEALARLVGRGGSIVAIDSDAAAVAALRRLAARMAEADAAAIRVVAGDVARLDAIAELADVEIDGALFGNVLHYFADPLPVLRAAVSRLGTGGRLVVLEYDGIAANPWVPHPLAKQRLASAAATLGLRVPRVVAERASRYNAGTLYCAVVER